jgi:hypothetical protein
MMRHPVSPVLVWIVVAIGCGGGQPQSASAKTEGAQVADAAATSAAAAPAAGAAATALGSASIRISARLEGAAPAREVVKMNADPVCQQQHTSPFHTEDVVVGDQGGLQNVFVYVKEGFSGTVAPPATPVTLNQAGCWYTPHVFGIQANQPLEIVNSDATLHNVNAKPAANPPFNVAQPVKGMKTTKKFPKPEIMVKFKCNVHPWMSAYAGVVAHPFFGVTDAAGAATIAGLPAGTYTLEAWHERYGAQTQSVTVGEGATASAAWTFKAP